MESTVHTNGDETFVIVGASLAGASAAVALRKQGFAGRVVLIGEENEPPYERPSLSKGYLRGEEARDALLVRDEAFYRQKDIELWTGRRVTAVDREARTVLTDDGETVPYTRLLLATGADARRLAVPGADLPGVHYLRTLGDADALRAAVARAGRVVVVGGGWIGAEVTASIRQTGQDVTLVVPSSVPLQRVLGTEIGAVYSDLHAEHGVRIVTGTRVEQILGSASVEGVRTGDGMAISCDCVVVGIGTVPRTELASDAGLAVDNGVTVDEYLEASQPGIYAAGDVAAARHPLFGSQLRIEHWDNAKRQGAAVAKSMLDRGEPYERIPYFYSDQYDVSMEYSGYAPSWDRVVCRGDVAGRQFIAFWLRDATVVAGMSANVDGTTKPIESLIRSRQRVHVGRLTDAAVPFEDLDGLKEEDQQ